jgi:hypothetical protein
MIGKAVVTAMSICAVIAGINLWISSADDNRVDGSNKQIARLRDGLSEVKFTTLDNSPKNARASVESLARFLRKRSGVMLEQDVKSKIAAMEEHVASRNLRRISANELDVILAHVVQERIAALSDQEIDYAIETLRGFNSQDLPDEYSRGRSRIRPRASVLGPKVTGNLVAQMRSLRNQASANETSLKFLLGSFMKTEVEARAKLLSEALPSQFTQDGTWSGPHGVKLTPVQAILIAYSVVSDDYLLDSEANQQKLMKALQEAGVKRAGHFPDPTGKFAYGVNGYVYSSPVDLFFNDQVVGRILQLIEERSTV